MNYAGFWVRFWASLIDGICLVPLVLIFWLLISIQALALIATPGGAEIFLFSGSIIAGWLYYAILESSSWQGTIGKKILNLRVVNSDGSKISFGQASGRYFSKTFLSYIFFIGFIIAGLHEKKRALHDIIAGTFVLRGSLTDGPLTQIHSSVDRRSTVSSALNQQMDSSESFVLAGFDPAGHVIRLTFSVADTKLRGNGLVIGRDPSASDLTIGDRSISRVHAKIRLIDSDLTLEDLSSTNGTMVGGIQVKPGQPRVLKVGEEITLGAVEVKLGKY